MAKSRTTARRTVKAAARRSASAARVMVVNVKRAVRGRYDAAQTTPDNRKHWSAADFYSADRAASAPVRKVIRERARYEYGNNCYAMGLTLTLANYLIGTGPRLQLLTPDPALNSEMEKNFHNWSRTIRLAEKLRTMRRAKVVDGEAFAWLHTNPPLRDPVKLDLRLIECDQVASENISIKEPGAVDGINFDAYGNPESYHLLSVHPGSGVPAKGGDNGKNIEASAIIHWFRADRPGQHRGLSELTPALELFALLRRYTLAVVENAEALAAFTLFLRTTAAPDGTAAKIEEGDFAEIEIARNLMTTLPEGWEPFQVKAEQPSATYEMAKRELLNEIARCVNVPYNIAACNSRGHNFSSGKLDHLSFYRQIAIDQVEAENVVLNPLFDEWVREAVKVYSVLGVDSWPRQWFWAKPEAIDAAKESTAEERQLNSSYSTTLAAVYARQGRDWEEELRQRGREMALMRELNLPLPSGAKDEAAREPEDDDEDKNEDEDEENDESEAKE